METDLTFLVATQADKGSHKNIRGSSQRINSHSAAFNHARKRKQKRTEFETVHDKTSLNFADNVLEKQQADKGSIHFPLEQNAYPSQALIQSSGYHSTFAEPSEGSINLHALYPYNPNDGSLNYQSVLAPTAGAVETNDGSPYSHAHVFRELNEKRSVVERHKNAEIDEGYESSRSSSWVGLRRTSSSQSNSSHMSSEIGGKLDPFIKLPVELSTYEQNLLHYFMSEGRRVICGTSINPKYDYFLNIASRQLETCPLYALSRVTAAEMLILKLTDRDHLINAYKRTAIMYRIARQIASDPRTSLESRLSMLINMSITEGSLQRHDFKMIHVQEVDRLIEYHGGLELFFNQRLKGTGMVEPYFLLTLFTWMHPAKFTEYRLLRKAVQKFIDVLRNISHWMLSLAQPCNQYSDAGESSHYRLDNYLYFLIDAYVRTPKQDVIDENPKTFILLLNICMTFVELQCDRNQAVKMLSDLQRDMIKSVTPVTVSGSAFEKLATSMDLHENYDLHPLHPSQVLGMLCHARRNSPRGKHDGAELSQDNIQEEVKMCSLSIDAAKLYPLLKRATQLRLAGEFLRCITSVNLSSGSVKCFDEAMLDDVKAELEESWFDTTIVYGI